MVDDDSDILAHVLVSVVDGFENIFARKTLLETDRGLPFTAGDRSVVVTVLECLSRTVSTSGSDVRCHVRNFVDDVDTSGAAIIKVERDIE